MLLSFVVLVIILYLWNTGICVRMSIRSPKDIFYNFVSIQKNLIDSDLKKFLLLVSNGIKSNDDANYLYSNLIRCRSAWGEK